jgi:hypothetical protein
MDTLKIDRISYPLRQQLVDRVECVGISVESSGQEGLAWIRQGHLDSLKMSLRNLESGSDKKRVVIQVKALQGVLRLEMDKATAKKLLRQLGSLKVARTVSE